MTIASLIRQNSPEPCLGISPLHHVEAKPSHRKPHAGNGHHTDTQVAQTDLTAVLQSINQAGCGGSRISPSVSYIVGGSEARANSWPWMASLEYNGMHVCGGSLVSDRYVITAAHCVEGAMATASRWRVRLGKHDRSRTESTEQNLFVRRIISHGSYSSSKISNDIALMELSSTATINDYVSPVCVAELDVAAGTNCITTGWGDTQGTGSNSVLRQVTVPMIDQATCASRDYYGRYMDTTTMICAGYEQGGKDSCQGDSGGPLVCSSQGVWHLTGVTSWGFGCAEAFKPGVYTRVVNYVSWLGANMA